MTNIKFRATFFAYSSTSPSASRPWYGTVTDDVESDLNVRDSPSTSSDIVGYVESGEAVQIVGKPNSSWFKVYYTMSGDIGYCSSEFLSTQRVSLKINSADGVNLRKSASNQGTILATVPNGTYLPYTKLTNGWYKVVWGTTVGYVSSDYVKLSD